MILISDSGSTKTDWVQCNENGVVSEIHTQGINPVHQSKEAILQIIERELTAHLDGKQPETVFFYGAGCAYEEANQRIFFALHRIFPKADIHISGDLLGVARALCGNEEGIACILGTGSNSCLYDGKKITANTPPLGYILGDEGSAAVLGRSLLSDCLKQQLSPELCRKFMEQYHLTTAIVLEKVYREPLANRFLGDLCPFLSENRENPEIHDLLMKNFSDFYTRNVMSYHRPWLPIHMVGSVAHQFSAELHEAAERLGLRIDNIVKSPLSGLVKYHREMISS